MASRHTGRKWAVGIVISVDAILLTLANEAFWACFTLLNTPGWVAIVGPLSKDQAVTELIMTDAFDNVWVPFNRTGHRTVMDVLKGKRYRLYFQEGNLTLDFSDLYNYVEDRLGIVERLDRIPQTEGGRLVLMSSQQVAVLQKVVSYLTAIGLLLPLLTIVTFGAAVGYRSGAGRRWSGSGWQ